MRKSLWSFKALFSLALISFSFQIGISQTDSTSVKRKYHTNETTVVVKEDAASDLDILNSQFDLNNFSMGDVIFIKTENIKPRKPKKDRTSFENLLKEEAKQIPATPTPPVQQPSKLVVKAAPQKKEGSKNKPALEIKKQQKYFGVGGARKLKMKKVKLKKRRKVKKNRRSCFEF